MTNTNDGDEMDPLARQHDDEPRFVLLARDPLASGLVRAWAALRGRGFDGSRDFGRFDAICANLKVTASKLPFHPDKDPEHVVSARGVADQMELWRAANTPRPLVGGRPRMETPDVEHPEQPVDAT